MKKYLLIENLGYDGMNFYSFESKKSTEELNKDLKEYLLGKNTLFADFGWIVKESKIELLEDFWKSYLQNGETSVTVI